MSDIEEHLRRTGSNGIDLAIVKLFILFYADDGVLLSESAQELPDYSLPSILCIGIIPVY